MRKVLITGGSRGIGEALSKRFLDEGCEIIIVARKKPSVLPPYHVRFFQCDLSEESDIQKLLGIIEENYAMLDVLINNAGTNIRKKFLDYTEEETLKIFNTNLFSALRLTRGLIPLLKKSAYPSVINISSVAGLGHMRTGIIYGMTKAAMNQMTKNMAAELAGENIRVNAIAPWYIETPLAMQVLKDKNYLKEVLDRTPMKRIGKPQEIAGLASFLAGPDASYITGQIIAVDGGFSINLF